MPNKGGADYAPGCVVLMVFEVFNRFTHSTSNGNCAICLFSFSFYNNMFFLLQGSVWCVVWGSDCIPNIKIGLMTSSFRLLWIFVGFF